MLTYEEHEALERLQCMLDYSGFHRESAYKVLGFQTPYAWGCLAPTGKRQIIFDNVRALTEALEADIPSGKYPECIKKETEIQQLQELLNKHLTSKH